MEMMACNCRRICVVGTCSCVDFGLKCTDACSLGDFEINDDENDEDLNEDNIVDSESDEDRTKFNSYSCLLNINVIGIF